MNPSDYKDYAVYGESFALLLDGKLDARSGRDLEQKLASDQEFRRFYYEYVEVHTMLRRELAGGVVDPAQTLGVIFGEADRVSAGEPADETAETGPSKAGGMGGRRQDHRRARATRPGVYRLVRTFSVAAMGALLVLSLYGLWTYLETADLPVLARVSGSREAYWESGGARGENKPVELTAGELFLRVGQLELTFKDGTVATIDAPSQVNLISGSHMRLSRGSVYVIAAPGVTGFRVSTPGAMATDLGTEFGVTYSHDFITEVHVFKGAVSMVPSRHALGDATEPTDHAVELHAGDSGLVNPDATMVRGLKADASLFVRDIDTLAGGTAAPTATRSSWLAYRDRLRSDPDLVACYDFTRLDNAPRVLRNIALGTGTRLNGDLGHPLAPETAPRWVRGRFPGGHALWFAPALKQYVELPNDNGELNIAGDMSAVWWMNPVHTFNRDYAMVVLGNGAPRNDYQAEREADNHFYAHGLKMGKLRAFHESGAGANREVLSSAMIEPERWTHVAIVRDSEKLVYRLYIDGELSDTLSYEANMTGGGSDKSAVTIGRSGGALLNHYDGRIDEMMIYARSLTGLEVTDLYQRSRPARQ